MCMGGFVCVYLSPMGNNSPLASFLSSITRELSTATSNRVFT